MQNASAPFNLGNLLRTSARNVEAEAARISLVHVVGDGLPDPFEKPALTRHRNAIGRRKTELVWTDDHLPTKANQVPLSDLVTARDVLPRDHLAGFGHRHSAASRGFLFRLIRLKLTFSLSDHAG
jgi:hypothetical protein